MTYGSVVAVLSCGPKSTGCSDQTQCRLPCPDEKSLGVARCPGILCSSKRWISSGLVRHRSSTEGAPISSFLISGLYGRLGSDDQFRTIVANVSPTAKQSWVLHYQVSHPESRTRSTH
jgi:hypothetical protein